MRFTVQGFGLVRKRYADQKMVLQSIPEVLNPSTPLGFKPSAHPWCIAFEALPADTV